MPCWSGYWLRADLVSKAFFSFLCPVGRAIGCESGYSLNECPFRGRFDLRVCGSGVSVLAGM